MTDFILVHGGAHGVWCWHAVAAALTSQGHRPLTFDLPGHGRDLTPRQTGNLDTSITAAHQFLHAQSLQPDAVLVGHSIAGMLLPALALAHPQIEAVVFLAALVLHQGERGIDLIPSDRRPSYFDLAAQSSDNTLWLDFPTARQRFFSDLPVAPAQHYYQQLTPQPFAPYLDPVPVGVEQLTCRRRFILCTRDRVFPPSVAQAMAAKLGVIPDSIDAGHDVMLSHPDEIGELLLSG